MSESMVERVARAIALAALDDETRAAIDPETWPVANSYIDMAEAAIEAMREPTKYMVRHGENIASQIVGNSMSQSDGRIFADHAFRAMIDAALK